MNEFEVALLKELKRIGDNLEKISEEKGVSSRRYLENVADEIEPFEPAMARLLLQYAK